MTAPPLSQLADELERILSAPLDDRPRLDALEALARTSPRFGALTYRFGPELYRKNKVMFRPFVLAHFATFDVVSWRWKPVPWKKHAASLDRWLGEVDAAQDVELFQRLWSWKHGRDEAAWRQQLLQRYRSAPTAADRARVLEMMEQYLGLDEPTALALYAVDRASSAFILQHLFGGLRAKLWNQLRAAAMAQGDEELAFALYRLQVDEKTWTADARALIHDRQLGDALLVAELTRRHPARVQSFGPVFVELIEQRGRGGLPYVLPHLGRLRSFGSADRGPFEKLLARALKEDWLELWGGLLRIAASNDEYTRALRGLLHDRARTDEDIAARLMVLAGASGELNLPGFGLAWVRPLDDETALAFYDRFPRLLDRHFRAHLVAGPWLAYPKLVSRLVEARDERLIEYLASRLLTRPIEHAPKEMKETVELLAAFYEGHRRDSAAFTERAGRVLGQVPAYSMGSYDAVIRGNRLGRLLLERSLPVYLDHPIVLRDLLEAPEIHVQLLAIRALGLDDPRARALAVENLDLLLPMLLRALHRKTRVEAFRALANAAQSPELARRIVQRAKEATALPDRRYPKEPLVAMIGSILARWPEARGPGETPVVYRRSSREVRA